MKLTSGYSLPAWARALLAWTPLALGLVLGQLASAPSAPLGPDAPADVFAAGRAMPVLERLVGDGSPHPVGSAANAALRERLVDELTGLGLEPELQDAFACNLRFELCGDVVNVIATLPGPDAGPVVLLTAHYDSVAAGPGVSDDLVGVAAVLEAARHLLSDGGLTNRVALLFSDGEEAGLLGARAFLSHPLSREVAVVVNVEARGTRGASLLFETSRDNHWLIRAFAAEAPRPMTSSLLYQVYELLPNDTDLTEYKSAGIAGVNFAYVDGLQLYHTPLDDLAHLSPASLQHQGENVLAAARAYAQADLSDPPAGGAIYTYVAPGLVAMSPIRWALPLAAIAVLGLLATLLLAWRGGQVTLAGWALGFVASVVAVGFAGLLGAGVSGLLTLLRPEGQPFWAQPLPARMAVWGLAGTAATLSVAVVARTAGRWGLTLGAWTLWAAATLTVAIVLPSASAELLLVLLVATALHVVTAVARPRGALLTAAATFLSATGTAYVLLPLALDLESGLGLGFAGPIAVVVGLVATTATPLLAGVRAYRPRRGGMEAAAEVPQPHSPPPERPGHERRARAALLAAAAAAVPALFGFGIALAVPAYTAAWPRHLTFTQLEEWEEGELTAARWLAAAEPGGPLPADVANVVEWQEPAPLLPWSSTRYFHAMAPAGSGAAPSVEVLSDETSGDERVLRLRLTTSAPVLRTVLRLPPEAATAEVRFVGTPNAWDFGRDPGLRAHTIVCSGAACDGRVIELSLRTSGPIVLDYAEVLPGLPPDGEALAAARRPNAVPSHLGDVTVRLHRITLP